MLTDTRYTLVERLLHDLDMLTDDVWRALLTAYPQLDELSGTSGLGADQLVRPLVDLLLGDPGTGSTATASVDARAHTQARALIAAGRPQQELVDYYDHTVSLITAQAWRRGRAGDHTELTELTGRAAAVLDTVQRVIVDTYWTQARADRFGRHGRRALAHALLTGRASDAGTGTYRTVVLRSADRTGTWREKASDLLHDERIAHCVLAQEVVLFEAEGVSGRLPVGARLGLDRVAAGAAVSPVEDLPEAVDRARLVACLALAVPLLDLVVSAEQLPLELTLLQDETFATAMCTLVEPIGMRPDLLTTIRVLYQLELNRTSTARRLGIARRTLSGRLSRIHELTSLDPTSTRGIQILHTALTAVSLRDANRSAPGA